MPRVFDEYSEYLSFHISSSTPKEQRKKLARLFSEYWTRTDVLLRVLERAEKLKEVEKELAATKAALEARESLYTAAQLVIETTDELQQLKV